MAPRSDALPQLVTPTIAKVNFAHLLAQAQLQQQRFLIVRGGKPLAILLGMDDFYNLAGLDQSWIDEVWSIVQSS